MKYVFILFLLCLSFIVKGQDDTSKYTKYPNVYGIQYPRIWVTKVLRIPIDTIYSKNGIAQIGSSFYVGNGNKWSIVSNTSSGTVTSVGLTVPTGFSVSNSPITSSGNLGLSFASGYSLPTTASQTLWDAAYTNRITSATSPLSITSNVLSISQATTSTNGYLSSTDWNAFNNKQAALGYTPYNSTNPSGYITSSSLPVAANPTTAIGLTATNGSATTFMRSDAAPSISQSITPTWTGVHTFFPTVASGLIINPTYTASATPQTGISIGGTQTARATTSDVLTTMRFTPTLVAAANSQVLVGLDIAPTFINGAFTAVGNISLRTSNWSHLGTATNTGIAMGSVSWNSSGTPIGGYLLYNAGNDQVYYKGSGGGFTHKFRTSSNDDANLRLQISDGGVFVPSSGVQLSIGTTTAAASAALQVVSTTKGLLPPVMTNAQKVAISSPATGLFIYCSDCTAIDGSTGVNQTYNGSTWKSWW